MVVFTAQDNTKPEYNITSGWKSLPVTNTLAYWTDS